MLTILETAIGGFHTLNTAVGFSGSLVTLYDHFKGNTHIKETLTAMRRQSKKAYEEYCRYRETVKEDIGVPLETDIVGYWESCMRRNILPSSDDMVSSKIADKEEAEILLPYLLEAWMQIPDFTGWLHEMLLLNGMNETAEALAQMQKSLESLPALTERLKQQSIADTALLLSVDRVLRAKRSCTNPDIKYYYMVDNNYDTMLRVISAEQDIPRTDVLEKIMELVQSATPILLSGNGGLGKTSLMMRLAVQWASGGGLAVWLSLSNKEIISEQKAAVFYDALLSALPAGQRALLCIDHPFEGKNSFSSLQKMWPNTDRIQLILAERANRLSLLADPDKNYLFHWFDNAAVVILQGTSPWEHLPHLKDYPEYPFMDSQKRRRKILKKCTSLLIKDGIITEADQAKIIRMMLDKFAKPSVSLVELIYRTLFELKKSAKKPADIHLDWEEWGAFIRREFEKNDTDLQLYGVIAALKVFSMPMTVSLFGRHFEIKEHSLKSRLNERLLARHIEPVIFSKTNHTLLPKHDVIAELFFLFNAEKISINDLILDLLDTMNETETDQFLHNIVYKREMTKGWKYNIGEINYWGFMAKIYTRMQNGDLLLTKAGTAYLCLGFLWAKAPGKSQKNAFLSNHLEQLAPAIDWTRPLLKLYTEWGIWAGNTKKPALAEDKLRAVIETDPDDIVSRTELGRLLSNQTGREKEAETLLLEVIQKDSLNIMSRTELGKLLAKQPERRKEAETFLLQVIEIDSRNVMARTELARLLSKQSGRQGEAEAFLLQVLEIDEEDIKARTELGKLLSEQKGREKEAEAVLQRVLEIDKANLHARTVLAGLYETCGRNSEAARLYQEICRYRPQDPYGRKGIARLKAYL
ncbi:MAG: hypothetical protein HFE83_03360 [Lachnospiraceae bacterium]|nr:hypothetical protein [Lachnospiraceae bacterium]